MTKFLGNLINFEESNIRPTSRFQDSTASGVFNLHEQLMLNKQSIWPTAGVDNPQKFIENIFSCHTYTGSSSSQTITNGIDLSGEGGMVWYRRRDGAENNSIEDTVRGLDKVIYTDSTNAEGDPDVYGIQAFNSNGFTAGQGVVGGDYISWTFRKAPNFFDVVSWSGNGSAGRQISHSLGSVPGMVIVKNLTVAGNGWYIFHRSLGNTKVAIFTTDLPFTGSEWNNTTPTDAHFTLSGGGAVNASGSNYVGYVFGHDTSSDGMIQCGSYTGDGGSSNNVNLGFEPQWVMIKASTTTNTTNNWVILDNIRGITTGDDPRLYANSTGAEVNAGNITLTPTGFFIESNNEFNYSGATYIYMAIRRAPMQTPTTRSSVFDVQRAASPFTADFPTDLAIQKNVTSAGSWYAITRLAGANKSLQLQNDGVEGSIADQKFDNMTEWGGTSWGSQSIGYSFRRAPNFFEIVTYVGTGSAKTENHGLGVVPEMMWVKNRSDSEDWAVYYGDATDYLKLNTDAATADDNAYWNDTAPTSTVFTIGSDDDVNKNNSNYTAYLFATLAGISKVGTFSHTNGSSTDVDCGFSSGSSFVIVKRTDSTGDWYVWDSARGIVSGNDSYMVLNTDAAENTSYDYIDTLNSGFQIASGFTTGSYMFYAIAS